RGRERPRLGRPDGLGGRVVGAQVRVIVLQLLQLAEQLVVLGVGDVGVAEHVVAVERVPQARPQLVDPPGSLLGRNWPPSPSARSSRHPVSPTCPTLRRPRSPAPGTRPVPRAKADGASYAGQRVRLAGSLRLPPPGPGGAGLGAGPRGGAG